MIGPVFLAVRAPVRMRGARDDERAVFLVDVGGGLGHDIDEFRRKFPDTPGHFVVQDVPVVIGQIQALDKSIEPMAYDFFTEKPIKDPSQVTAAMEPGYSKLLINENVIPKMDADWRDTCLDLLMVAMVSTHERKEQEWRSLLEQAGLKVLKIWMYENGVKTQIECELA